MHMGSLVPSYPLQPATRFAAGHTAMNIFKINTIYKVSGRFSSSFQCLSYNMFGRDRDRERDRERGILWSTFLCIESLLSYFA
jgi:hypothetical protein